MPELPELTAHAVRIAEAYGGAELARFEPLSFTALKTFDPPPDAAVGQALTGVGRRGKYLLLGFGDITYVVHLMQGGRLRPDTGKSKRPKTGVARWVFAGSHPSLILTEAGTERRAGVWVVGGDPHGQPPLGDLGPDADTVDAAGLTTLLAAHSMRLHTFLRDQRIIAGVGRRLANEICHRARLSPFARTAGLDAAQVGAVVTALRDLVAEGIADEGERTEMSAAKERPAAVHARTGEACPVCADTVRAVEYRDYTVNYCATCQTGGKVLADNTTSKFLK
jgi:formamidopyrimidine-DNA glycosylase